MKRRLIGYYDYTVILTYCGMLSALIGIMMVLNGRGHFITATILLLVAGLCDMFDGAVASTKDRDQMQKNFGVQIDSLGDLVSFGVFPAIFEYCLCGKTISAGIIACFYTLCGLIRLAYFNVLEAERQAEDPTKKKTFMGMPITTIALLLPAAYFVFRSGIIRNPEIISVVLAISAVGFVTPIEIKKPGKRGKLIIIAIGAVILAGVIWLLVRKYR